MTEKRFSIKEESSIGLSSIYTDNGKVMTQLEVLDVLIKQHETIQTLAKENEELKQNCKNYEWYKQYKAVLNENEQLKQRNTNPYNQLTELWEIIEEENWENTDANYCSDYKR